MWTIPDASSPSADAVMCNDAEEVVDSYETRVELVIR